MIINIESVSYSYPNTKSLALVDINLRVNVGEFVLLVGPSGSGKTSLLRALNGLIPHFSGGEIRGHVEVDKIDVFSAGPQSLSQIVGFVSQVPENQALLEKVEPEIAFPLENAGIPEDEMRDRVEEVLALLDLVPLRERKLNTLSGGERQKVCIATALALRPRILLLDEPTSQLDPQSAEDVLQSIIRLNEELDFTIILSEHRLDRILGYADRLVYMDNGQILVDDDVKEALNYVPDVPPIVRLGKRLGWNPTPLTVLEGKRFVERMNFHKASWGVDDISEPNIGQDQHPLLRVNELNFSYGNSHVLNNLRFQLNGGEALVIMGRNGSGKSTLLKSIIGLLQPETGEIEVNGRTIIGRPVHELALDIAYLPQNPDDLLFAESVIDEFEITLKNHGLTAPGYVLELLQDLGLAEYAKSYPRDLSTGQRQRVALGAVAITNPKLLMLDEPTRGLDSAAKNKLVEIWKSWLDSGKGLLVVTHDVELAAMIADNVMILSQGEMLAYGSKNDVLSASPMFMPQVASLFPGQRWLTTADVFNGLGIHIDP